MTPDFELLLQLQEIDLRIREQEMAQEQYPAAVAELEQQINTAKKSLETTRARLAKAEQDRNNIEEQAQKARDGLDKSQERLSSIKTNREYDAVHAEIEAQKNIASTAEGKKSALTGEIDKLKIAVEEAEKELERVSTENEPKITELKDKIGAIDSTIAKITEERNIVVPKISKPLIRTYDLIRKKRKNGKVVSRVSTARNCTICFKVLEPQLMNEIKRGLKTIICQNCGSILIWTDEPPQAREQE